MTALTSGPGWVDEVKRWPVADVANRLGLEVHRQGVDVSFPCPACRKVKRHSKGTDPRFAAKVMGDGRWWCEPCGASGDAVALACAVVTGDTTTSRERWREVRDACIDVGLCVPDHGHQRRSPATTIHVPPAASPQAPAVEYPPKAEVEAFWSACAEVISTSGPGAYLASRGFNVARLPWLHVVREAPATEPTSAAWWPASWRQAWPLLFPAYDAAGQLRSIHARAVEPKVEPKTRWPYRRRASGLLFADGAAVDFLRSCSTGRQTTGLEGVVVVEGATDTLKVAQVLEGLDESMVVLGYVAGSKQALAEIEWPSTVPCLVATDDDDAGDRYAAEVCQALGDRADVYRVRAPQGRDAAGVKRGDWSDLPDDEVLDAVTAAANWETLHV